MGLDQLGRALDGPQKPSAASGRRLASSLERAGKVNRCRLHADEFDRLKQTLGVCRLRPGQCPDWAVNTTQVGLKVEIRLQAPGGSRTCRAGVLSGGGVI